MPQLQKIALGTPPEGRDGDAVRTGFTKVNANVDVLAACVALGYSFLVDSTTLTAANAGARFGLNMGDGKMVKLPLAASVPGGANLHLFNAASPVTIGLQGNDGTQITVLNKGDWATYCSDGSGYWHVVERGRMLPDEMVSGNLSVGGKVIAVHAANLLVNSSGELRNQCWTGVNFGWLNGSFGEGTQFINAAAINTPGYVMDVSDNISCASGVQLNLSAEIATLGLNAGQIYMKLEAFNSSNSLLATFAMAPITAKRDYTLVSVTGKTPGGTAYVRVSRVADNAPNVAQWGVAFRRIKLERGQSASLYSQEASIQYLQNMPAFEGRPTFAGKVPWDSGNFDPASKLNIAGRTDGVAPAAGNVGEIITTSNSTVSLPGNRTPVGTTTLNLGPGEWDVQGSMIFNYNASGVLLTMAFVGVATSSGSITAGQFAGIDGLSTQGWATFVTPMVRFRFSTATTVWLNAQAGANAGVPGFGHLTARRVAA